MHDGDIAMIDHLDEQTATYGASHIEKPEITPFVALMPRPLPLGIKVIHTPGHSPGSSTFLAETLKGKVALTGDTLFAQGVGRTDLWGGDWETLENSIRTKLYTLDPETLVIPGHGPNTTIATERGRNPYVKA
jgi:glyoxylase-like metal-dependent hydrolase (beta-lactamase superfamily II)